MVSNPRKFQQPYRRLIVNVDEGTVEEIDSLMKQGNFHQHKNRAEFVRQAIERELDRCHARRFYY